MNILLYEKSEILSGNRLEIRDRRADHLKNILKVSPGKKIRVGQINAGSCLAEVKKVSDICLELQLSDSLSPQDDSIFSHINIVLCLPRPQSFKKVLELIGTLGVGRLLLINSARVEKSYFNSPVFSEEKIKEHLLLGMEQGGVVNLPQVEIFKEFKINLLEEEALNKASKTPAQLKLEELFIQSKSRFLADVNSIATFSSLYKCKNDLLTESILLAIGPEGGWLDFELEVFKNYNFNFINLGNRILRVETAIAFILAQISLISELEN